MLMQQTIPISSYMTVIRVLYSYDPFLLHYDDNLCLFYFCLVSVCVHKYSV